MINLLQKHKKRTLSGEYAKVAYLKSHFSNRIFPSMFVCVYILTHVRCFFFCATSVILLVFSAKIFNKNGASCGYNLSPCICLYNRHYNWRLFKKKTTIKPLKCMLEAIAIWQQIRRKQVSGQRFFSRIVCRTVCCQIFDCFTIWTIIWTGT